MCSRLVKGRVKHEYVCSNCLWRDEFVHEAKVENGILIAENKESDILQQTS